MHIIFLVPYGTRVQDRALKSFVINEDSAHSAYPVFRRNSESKPNPHQEQPSVTLNTILLRMGGKLTIK